MVIDNTKVKTVSFSSTNPSIYFTNEAFIRSLYENSDSEWKSRIAEEFPTLFPPPTFCVGDQIEMEVSQGVLRLMIISGINPNTTGLVNIFTGKMKDYFATVRNQDKITEEELLNLGRRIGLTKRNYKKVDCSKPLETVSCYDKK
jgi:hypothetical protein